MKIIYQEHDLDTVLRYFVAGFANGIDVKDYKATCDPAANRVVFKLYVGEPVESHFPKSESNASNIKPKGTTPCTSPV